MGIIGHRGAGKTTLAETLLCAAGAVRSPGSVDRGTALLDHHDEERRKKQTFYPGFAWLEWAGTRVSLIDTPGSDVGFHEAAIGLAGADGALLVVDGVAGVELGTRRVLAECATRRLPMVAVINKVDRPEADLDALLEALAESSGRRPVLLQLPFTDDHTGRLTGLVGLREQRVYRYAADGSGAFSPEPVPVGGLPGQRAMAERLVEAVALTDDDLLEHYLEYLELAPDALESGLARAVRSGELLPVYLTSAAANMGAASVLDAIVEFLPGADRHHVARHADGFDVSLKAGDGFCAQLVATQLDEAGDPYHVLRVVSGTPPRGAWVHAASGLQSRVHKLYELRGPRRRTASYVGAGAILATWEPLPGRPGDTFTAGEPLALPQPLIPAPMMAFQVEPAPRDDGVVLPQRRAAFNDALQDLLLLDRGLELHVDETTGGLLLAGQSEAHLERAIHRLQHRYGAPVQSRLPPVGYREVPVAPVADIEGLHIREDSDGMVAEYGLCTVTVEPTRVDGRGTDLLPVVETTVDDLEALPEKYWPAIGEGIEAGLRHGPTAGFPVVGLKVRLTGGEYNMLSSTDDHFRLAGERALQNALARSGTRLLEPWCHLTVTAPSERVGDVLTDLASHRARIVGLEVDSNGDGASVIRALAPFQEIRTFAGRLQTRTHGEGAFQSSISHYEPVPDHLLPDAIASSPFRAARP